LPELTHTTLSGIAAISQAIGKFMNGISLHSTLNWSWWRMTISRPSAYQADALPLSYTR